MPTFTAIAFDRLIEPGASESMVPPIQGREIGSKLERGVPIPHNPRLVKRNNKEHHWTQISPALYATPKSTPLPDSPSSFPPSPYIINHKRRGPRLMKSFSEYDVAAWKHDEIKVVDENENGVVAKDDSCVSINVPDLNSDGNIQPSQNGVLKSLGINSQQDGEVDESMSAKSESDVGDDAGAQAPSINLMAPLAEFYDAWEELSSENGTEIQLPDIESELREIRLGLLMEIEKRKRTEEALCHMTNQWQIIREKLCLLGLTLPVVPTTLPDGEQQRPEDLVCQQVHVARFVSNSIGRGIAKAEVEMEMEAQIKLKNIEIARLWDRLHYYEAVNQEMSQRNQQVVEMTRRLRQKRKRRQKWMWGSIASAITIGSAALAYSYFHTSSQSPSVDRDTN